MNYYNAFIHVATDCPAQAATAPMAKGARKSIPALEYEMLSAKPYFYNQEELQFETYVRHKDVPEDELALRRQELWAEFFAKPRACLRASSLAKTYGWGIHFDADGKIALAAMESDEYRRFAGDPELQQVPAMRSRRA